jgi:hypothetical protein
MTSDDILYDLYDMFKSIRDIRDLRGKHYFFINMGINICLTDN